jgi:hypothetical protein
VRILFFHMSHFVITCSQQCLAISAVNGKRGLNMNKPHVTASQPRHHNAVQYRQQRYKLQSDYGHDSEMKNSRDPLC